VVYIILLISGLKLKHWVTASQLFFQIFIAIGYFSPKLILQDFEVSFSFADAGSCIDRF